MAARGVSKWAALMIVSAFIVSGAGSVIVGPAGSSMTPMMPDGRDSYGSPVEASSPPSQTPAATPISGGRRTSPSSLAGI